MKGPTLYDIIVKSDDCYLFHLLLIWCINTYTSHIKIIKTNSIYYIFFMNNIVITVITIGNS